MKYYVADFETSKSLVFSKKEKVISKKEKKVKMGFDLVEENGKKFFVEKEIEKAVINRKESETWVYLWCMCDSEGGEPIFGFSIEDFMNKILNLEEEKVRIYFHNLKFDGSFILYYMLNSKKFKQYVPYENSLFCKPIMEHIDNFYFYENGRKSKKSQLQSEGYIEKGKCTTEKYLFTLSQNGMGVMYSITIYILRDGEPMREVEILDSTKLLNFSVEELGVNFLGGELEKEQYDYNLVRYANSPKDLSEKDFSYVEKDVRIVLESLDKFKNSEVIAGDTSLSTMASIALSDFKTELYRQATGEVGTKAKQEKLFREICPELPSNIEQFVRRSYKGGFCYVNPCCENKINYARGMLGMCVLDVNSLFPYIMRSKPMPYGQPIRKFENKIEIPTVNEEVYDYYFVRVKVDAVLKPKKIPSLVLKPSDVLFNPESLCTQDEWLESTEGEIELVLSKDDYELMHEQYKIISERIEEVMYFRTLDGLFECYIAKWEKIKIQATIDKNPTLRQIAKLFLNSLYGKFGAKIKNISKFVKLENGYLQHDNLLESSQAGVFIPIASAITSGARRKTITTAQRVRDWSLKHKGVDLYYYSDTDSIHTGMNTKQIKRCLGNEIDWEESGVFGLWKVEENTIIKSKFIRAKTYLEERKEPIKGQKFCSGVAGLPKKYQKYLKWEHFTQGSTFLGCLKPYQVKGGQVLFETPFSLKKI